MARISLLFSLALVIAISSVSAHPPFHKRFEKSVSLSELQSYTSDTISKIVQRKAHQSIQQTVQFKTLFNVCKGFTEYLKTFKNYSGAKNAVALIKAKYTVMSSMMRVAQATVGVEGSLKVMLSASYDGMSNNFNEIAEKLALISAKYKFNAMAKISQSDLTQIDDCLVRLKGSIRIYFKVITDVSKKCSSPGDVDFRARIGSGFLTSFAKQGLGFDGQASAKAGAKVGVGFKVGAGAQGSAKAGAEAKVEAHVEAKAGGDAGRILRGLEYGHLVQPHGPKSKVVPRPIEHLRGEIGAKLGLGAQAGAEAKVGADVGAKAGGDAGRILRGLEYSYRFPPPRSSFGKDKPRVGRAGEYVPLPTKQFSGKVGAEAGAQAGAEPKEDKPSQ